MRRESDVSAASKLKIGIPVPETAATVTPAARKMPPNGSDKHLTLVGFVHDDVKHTPRSPAPPCSSPADAVCSPTPKLRPVTVRDAYPVCGAFNRTSETAAASKLNAPVTVPATPPTVTDALACLASDAMADAAPVWQLTVVEELQIDVRHTAPERNDVCENSQFAKLRPVTVTDA